MRYLDRLQPLALLLMRLTLGAIMTQTLEDEFCHRNAGAPTGSRGPERAPNKIELVTLRNRLALD